MTRFWKKKKMKNQFLYSFLPDLRGGGGYIKYLIWWKFTLHTNLYFVIFFLKYRLNFSKISIKKYFKQFFNHIWRDFEKRKKWKTSFFEDFTQNEVAEIQDFVKIWCFLRIYITYKPRFHFFIFKISTQFFKNKHLKVF